MAQSPALVNLLQKIGGAAPPTAPPKTTVLTTLLAGKTKPRPKPKPKPAPKGGPSFPLPGYPERKGLDEPTIWRGKGYRA